MTRPVHSAEPPSRAGRALARVLGNAALLAFASLAVIAFAAGHFAAALLWLGALLVFFAPALDRAARVVRPLPARLVQRADTLRWCGLALAVVGAALVLG